MAPYFAGLDRIHRTCYVSNSRPLASCYVHIVAYTAQESTSTLTLSTPDAIAYDQCTSPCTCSAPFEAFDGMIATNALPQYEGCDTSMILTSSLPLMATSGPSAMPHVYYVHEVIRHIPQLAPSQGQPCTTIDFFDLRLSHEPNVLGVGKADPGVGRRVDSGLAALRLCLTFFSMSIVHLLCVVCTLTPSSSDSMELSVYSASSLSPNAVGCCSCICNTIA